jgi:hypothetical protein
MLNLNSKTMIWPRDGMSICLKETPKNWGFCHGTNVGVVGSSKLLTS